MTEKCHDIQHNDIQHNDIQHNEIQHNDIQHNDIQHNDIQHHIFSVKQIVVVLNVIMMMTRLKVP
jgi:hypothetical protein